MKRILIFCFLLSVSVTIRGQESELVVRYGFTDKSSPPMKIFYLNVFVDGIFADSTKPHMPNHNLANAVHVKLAIGPHNIRIEGCVKEKKDNVVTISKVMVWTENLNVTKRKSRVGLKMNGDYEVVGYTVTDF